MALTLHSIAGPVKLEPTDVYSPVAPLTDQSHGGRDVAEGNTEISGEQVPGAKWQYRKGYRSACEFLGHCADCPVTARDYDDVGIFR